MKYGSSRRFNTATNSSSLVLKCQKIRALLTCASRATSDIEVSWNPRLANRCIAALRISSRESCAPRESPETGLVSGVLIAITYDRALANLSVNGNFNVIQRKVNSPSGRSGRHSPTLQAPPDRWSGDNICLRASVFRGDPRCEDQSQGGPCLDKIGPRNGRIGAWRNGLLEHRRYARKPAGMIRVVGDVVHQDLLGASLPLGKEEPLTANFERPVRSDNSRMGSPLPRVPRQVGTRPHTAIEGHIDFGGFIDPITVAAKSCSNRARQCPTHQPLHQVKDVPSMIDQNSTARFRARSPRGTRSTLSSRFDTQALK